MRNILKQIPGVSNTELKAIRSFKKALAKKYKILDFKLFGSKARDNSAPDSDIDIMITLPDYNFDIENNINDLLFETNLKYNVFISKIIFSKDELENGPMNESPLYKVIQKEGIAV